MRKRWLYLLRGLSLVFAIWIIFFDHFRHSFMIWNLFLAWLPLEFVLCQEKLAQKKATWRLLLVGGLWFLWLIFYPNAPYILTDFIHLSQNDYYSLYRDSMFRDNMREWLDFLKFTLGSLLGYMVGAYSLYLNHQKIVKRFSVGWGWLFVVAINGLTGLAIFVGRFHRFNSWEIISRPEVVVEIIRQAVTAKGVAFTLLFGLMSLISYLFVYVLLMLGRIEEREEH